MTYVDLDKSGNYGYADERMIMGPTLGRVDKPTRLTRQLTTGVASTVQPWDAWLYLNLTVKAAYSLTFPLVRNWMSQPYGQIPILLKFLNDNDGLAWTLLPTGADTIDGLASVQIAAQVGLAPFPSMIIRPRADLLGWIVT